ncbi:MAG TPA: hypothetical protein VD794_01730, partial [Flavisolibacter sp.]|nr:hypothetical protein [Flavisolibacter sp.]
MRKVLLVLLVAVFATNAFAVSFPSGKEPLAATVNIPLLNSGKHIPLSEFVTLTPKRYKQLTGKSLSLSQRLE